MNKVLPVFQVRQKVRPENGLKWGFIVYGLTVLPVLPKNNTRMGLKKRVANNVTKKYVFVLGKKVRK